MKSQKHLQEELEEKDKVLSFLKDKYERDTGKQLTIPHSKLFISLSPQPNNKDALESEPPMTERTVSKYSLEDNKFQTFTSKLNDLKLPKTPYHKGNSSIGSSKSLKVVTQQLRTAAKKQPALSQYLTESIDLSGFEGRGFSRAALQELLRGVENLVSVRTIKLQRNGMADECLEEICQLIRNPNIQNLNLSCNKLGREAGQGMAKALSETSHLLWFE